MMRQQRYKIAYFDNASCALNQPELMHELYSFLLEWVESHDALLTIKTKSRPAKRKLRWGHMWMLGRIVPGQDIYKDYPQCLKDKTEKLIKCGNLEFKYGIGNIEPARTADAVIVTLAAEIAFEMIDAGIKRIIILDQHHYLHHNGIMRYNHQKFDKAWKVISQEWRQFKITDEVEFCDTVHQIKNILDTRYNVVSGRLGI